jgi:60 kDa SS-A/Ro ribonucleoprotein
VSANYQEHFATRTPQSRPISNRQALNAAGGYAFPVDDWTRLDRFLVLGSEGGTYYQSERALTIENAQAVQRAIREDGLRVVARIVEISDSGRAPKNDPALFALALCAAAEDVAVRRAAMAALPKVARIGTHLFQFARYVRSFRGWGPALRKGVARWYTDTPVDKLALQAIKYPQRGGVSHRDMLRWAHPKADGDDARKALFDCMCRGESALAAHQDVRPALEQMEAAANLRHTVAAAPEDAADRVAAYGADVIREHRLPREAVPSELLNRPEIWAALLDDMPITATIRNLGKMTAVGLLTPGSDATATVAERIVDAERLRRGRVHPLALLVAQKVYAQGHGERSRQFRGEDALTWQPVPAIVDALDRAFYLAFGNVMPTGKRLLLALDVSGSMDGGRVCDSPLTPREATAALALVAMKTEDSCHVCAFAAAGGEDAWRPMRPRWGGDGITPLNISPCMGLSGAIEEVSRLPFGGTDCALPMLYAMEHGIEADAFVVYTDSETWAGAVHPMEALRAYRSKTGIQAKLIVCAMTSAGFSIADPEDGGCLDVVGMDLAVPQLIADFVRGEA